MSRRQIALLGAFVSLSAGSSLFAAPPLGHGPVIGHGPVMGLPRPTGIVVTPPRPIGIRPIGVVVSPPHPIGISLPPHPIGITTPPRPVGVIGIITPPPTRPPPVGVIGIIKPPPHPIGIVVHPPPHPIGVIIVHPQPIGIIVIPPRPPIIIGIIVRPPPYPFPPHRPWPPRPYPVPYPVPYPYPVGPGPVVVEPPPVVVDGPAEQVESWALACVGGDQKQPLQQLAATLTRTNVEAFDIDAMLKFADGKSEPFQADSNGTVSEAGVRLGMAEQGGLELEPRKDDRGNTVYVGGVKLPGAKDAYSLQCNMKRN